MKRFMHSAAVFVAVLGLISPVHAEGILSTIDNAPNLYIQAIRVKVEEFIALKNRCELPLDLAKYKLQYFNDVDATTATSSKLIDLSAAIVPPGGSVFLITEPLYACESAIVFGSSLGFTDKNGLVQLVEQTQLNPGAPIELSILDSVAWSDSKTLVDGIQPALTNGESFYWRQTTEVVDITECSECYY